MSQALYERARAADFILREVEPSISREVVMISGGDFEPGSILSLSDGKYGPLDVAHEDVVVLYARVDASETDKQGLVIARQCSLKSSHLFWPEGISEADKAAVMKKMENKLLIVRGGH